MVQHSAERGTSIPCMVRESRLMFVCLCVWQSQAQTRMYFQRLLAGVPDAEPREEIVSDTEDVLPEGERRRSGKGTPAKAGAASKAGSAKGSPRVGTGKGAGGKG